MFKERMLVRNLRPGPTFADFLVVFLKELKTKKLNPLVIVGPCPISPSREVPEAPWGPPAVSPTSPPTLPLLHQNTTTMAVVVQENLAKFCGFSGAIENLAKMCGFSLDQ